MLDEIIPFASLKVTNSVREDEAMARANRLDNAAGKVIFTATRVRLIHCMELAAAALNLECMRRLYFSHSIHVRLSHEDYLQRGARTLSSQQNTSNRIQVPGR